MVYFCKALSPLSPIRELTFFAVYPETMGVPLEEMDAVFGEGKSSPLFPTKRNLTFLSRRRTTRGTRQRIRARVARISQPL